MPRDVGVKALRKLEADCELALAKIEIDRKTLRGFVAEIRSALKQTRRVRTSHLCDVAGRVNNCY